MSALTDPLGASFRPAKSFVRYEGRRKRSVKLVQPTPASIYLARRFIGGPETCTESAGRVSLPSLLLRPGGVARDSDLLIARVSRRVGRMMAAGRDVIRVPEHVRFIRPLPLSSEDRAYIRKAQADNLRRIRKYRLSYSMSDSKDDFDFFWFNMVLPYAKDRFGDLAEAYTYERVLETFRRGGIMFVLQDGRRAAGALLDLSGGRVHCQSLGTDVNADDLMAKGALSAIYHFAIEWAEREGYSYVDLGTTRPCLVDGVFRTKCRWGAQVVDDARSYDLVFRCAAGNPSVRRFFEKNPLVLRDGDGLSAIGALPRDEDRDAFKARVGSKLAPGLKRLLLLPDSDGRDGALAPSRLQADGRTALLPAAHNALSAARP